MRRTPSSSGPWSSLERADFAARVAGLSIGRLVRWQLAPDRYPRPTHVAPTATPHPIAEITLPKRASSFGPRLERGRWHNLELAATALHGIGISAHRPFSFWRTVGRLTESRGYVEGAHFEGGCIVPAVGGGICSLSDALFDLALRSGCDILERHGHTLTVDRGPAAPRRRRVDATVKWPYVDLRFAPTAGVFRISTRSSTTGLTLMLHSSVRVEACTVEVSEPRIERRAGLRYVHTTISRRGHPDNGRLTVIGHDKKRVITRPSRNCDTCRESTCRRSRGSS